MNENSKDWSAELWRQAQRLREESQKDPGGDGGLRGLLLESQINQVELELQNEELRRTYAELDESQSRLRHHFDDAPVAFLSLDPQGKILDLNHAAASLLEESRESLLEANLTRFVDEVGLSALKSLIRSCLEEASLHRAELSLRRNGGASQVLMQARAVPGQASSQILAAAVDLTPLRRAESAQRQSDRLAQATLDALGGSICVLDEAGTIVSTNRAWQEFAAQNLGPGESVGLNYLGVCSAAQGPGAKDAQTMAAGLGQVLRGELSEFSLQYEYPERQLHFLARVARLQDSDPIRVVVSHQDVTAQVQTQQAARQALSLLDAVEDGAYVLNADTMRFTYVNQGAVDQTAYRREELLGMTPLDLHVVPDETEMRHMLSLLKADPKQVVHHTAAIRTKDGREVMVEVRAQALPGDPTRCIAMVRDVTDRLRAHRRELQTQRLESIGSLASGVAHNLKNVLTPVCLATEMLRVDFPQEGRELLQTIEVGSAKAVELVRQLLTFARGLEGQRLRLLVPDLLKDIEHMIGETFPKSIELDWDIAPDLWPVQGDANQLVQVLLNLCLNAKDAMPGGGILTVQARNLELDANFVGSREGVRPGPFVRVQVHDTGTGIPEEIMDSITEPFFTTKEAGQGTGLGLSTTVGILRGHGGFLEIESQVGRGSTFNIYLPAWVEQPIAPPATPTHLEEFRGDGQLILLVEDEQKVSDILTEVLQRTGFRVLRATDGTEGLLAFTQHSPEIALVITDLAMPHMDGIALIRALRRLSPEVEILPITGVFEERVRAELRALKLDDALDKPFSRAQLLARLKVIPTLARR